MYVIVLLFGTFTTSGNMDRTGVVVKTIVLLVGMCMQKLICLSTQLIGANPVLCKYLTK